jgi:hypothetical protein
MATRTAMQFMLDWAEPDFVEPEVQPRRRTLNDTEFAEVVAGSKSIREVMTKIGYSRIGGGTFDLTKKRIATLRLDISHMPNEGNQKPPGRAPNPNDLTGRTINLWFVMGIGKRKGHYICRCTGLCSTSPAGATVREVSRYSLTGTGKNPTPRSRGCECTRIDDLRERKFGKLTAKIYMGQNDLHQALWECECECGNLVVRPGIRLTQPEADVVQSCGCGHYKGGPNQGHGYAKTNEKGIKISREYRILQGIIQRCTNPNIPRYNIYGGRGITVCKRWYDPTGGKRKTIKIENFIEDVGLAPFPDWEADRKDPDGNYEPGNVRWAPEIVQVMNKRRYLAILEATFGADWADHLINCSRQLKEQGDQ